MRCLFFCVRAASTCSVVLTSLSQIVHALRGPFRVHVYIVQTRCNCFADLLIKTIIKVKLLLVFFGGLCPIRTPAPFRWKAFPFTWVFHLKELVTRRQQSVLTRHGHYVCVSPFFCSFPWFAVRSYSADCNTQDIVACRHPFSSAKCLSLHQTLASDSQAASERSVHVMLQFGILGKWTRTRK